MDRILIRGGNVLRGNIHISGAKNAALPLMIAALLTDETLTLTNMPRLADVSLLRKILRNQGADTTLAGKKANANPFAGDTVRIRAEEITDTTAPYELVSKMRASFWVLGPILARCHEARVSLPGGGAIGTRPVDFYLTALEEMGAQIDMDAGYVVARAPGGYIFMHPVTQLDISSTRIRALIRAGRSPRYLLPDGVWNHIRERGLYQ